MQGSARFFPWAPPGPGRWPFGLSRRPEIGRFLQQDPIGEGMNWYAYVGNNPVVWVDPEGLHETTSFWHNVFDPEVGGRQLVMSAKATAGGVITGATAGLISPNWNDPCDEYANWSRNWGIVSGAAITAAVGARATGFNPKLGGVKLNQAPHHTFRVWNRFRFQARHADIWLRNPLNRKAPFRIRVPHSGFRRLRPRGPIVPPEFVPPVPLLPRDDSW